MRLPGISGAGDGHGPGGAALRAVVSIVVEVPGEPVPWAGKVTNRKTGERFLPSRQAEAAGRIIDAVGRQHPGRRLDRQPLGLRATFFVTRPKSHYGSGRNAERVKASSPLYPGGRPDLSNLVKLLEDGLVLSGLLPDDDQIVEIVARKVYAGIAEPPRTIAEIDSFAV